jgi:hypothetical protein
MLLSSGLAASTKPLICPLINTHFYIQIIGKSDGIDLIAVHFSKLNFTDAQYQHIAELSLTVFNNSDSSISTTLVSFTSGINHAAKFWLCSIHETAHLSFK